jgi:hypothetical protein
VEQEPLWEAPAEELAWAEPSGDDLVALTLHDLLERIGSDSAEGAEVELQARLDAVTTREGAIARLGGGRDELSVRRARRLVNRVIGEFLTGPVLAAAPVAGAEATEEVAS